MSPFSRSAVPSGWMLGQPHRQLPWTIREGCSIPTIKSPWQPSGRTGERDSHRGRTECTPLPPGPHWESAHISHFHSRTLARLMQLATPSCKVGWKSSLYSGQPWLVKFRGHLTKKGKTVTEEQLELSDTPGTLQVPHTHE